jgi:clan AA aspartic protease
MNGIVDNGGRALIAVKLKNDGASGHEAWIDVWIDTGFTGDLVLPKASIEALSLEKSGSVDAILADGSQTELSTFTCTMEWFGRTQTLEIISNDGEYPLLGVGLLLGLELRIDYRNLILQLIPAKPGPASS